MRLELTLHPGSQCDALSRIAVDIARPNPATLALTYVATGTIAELLLPPASLPSRTDGLWRHTCFEAFLRPASAEDYIELNVAPSTQWAAYRFDRYRAGMRAADDIAPLNFVDEEAGRLEVRTEFALPAGAVWRLGLSAVIEEKNGRLSYWALTHPPGKADFHHSDSFSYELPPA